VTPKPPAPVPGILRLVLDDSQKVREIFFLRQLTREEKKYRLKHRPSQLYTDFKAKGLVGPTLDLDDSQVAKMHKAAEGFNEASFDLNWVVRRGVDRQSAGFAKTMPLLCFRLERVLPDCLCLLAFLDQRVSDRQGSRSDLSVLWCRRGGRATSRRCMA
jgi:hypothetical protein